MPVRRMALKRQAEDAIAPMLEPGERILAGSAVACGPSQSPGAWGSAVALAPVTAGLGGIFGPQPSPLSASLLAAIGLRFPVLLLYFASPPLFLSVHRPPLP